MTNESMPEWLNKPGFPITSDWAMSDNTLVSLSEKLPDTLEFYDQVGGVGQDQWSRDKTRAAYYDHPKYRALVEKTVASVDHCGSIIDLGAGDGRITQMLLGSTSANVISLDFHGPSIQRLNANVSDSDKERHISALGPVESLPVVNSFFDVLTCVEVLMTVKDRQLVLSRIKEWLRPGGATLIIEPAIEGSIVYALLASDHDEVQRIISRNQREDEIGQARLSVRLATKQTLRDELIATGMTVEYEESISAGAALLLSEFNNNGTEIGPVELEMISSINDMSLQLPRMHAVIAKKPVRDLNHH
jgi:ubiquinone/menaquinone biosynthesis C-methylase UbiE